MTFRQTLHNIKTDYIAVATLMQMKLTFARWVFLFFSPSIVAVTFYRFSRYFYVKKLRPLAWFLWQLNIYITGADILPTCDIGESFYLGHPTGLVLAAKMGRNVKLFGQACIGGGLESSDDVGAGPGLPVIGDNVWIGFRSLILGPITIGNNAKVGPMTFVNKSVPENATAIGNPCRIVQGREPSA